jgi:gamma-D-glutamyl-L-lysine dipeptidyl-peptidase
LAKKANGPIQADKPGVQQYKPGLPGLAVAPLQKQLHSDSMNSALCHLSVVPLRNSPSDRSEQISQLLFGEIVEILEKKGRAWSKVRCTWDHCIGWVQTRQLRAITETEHRFFDDRYAFCLDLFQPIHSDNYAMPVTIGSRLPDFDGMKFSLGGKTFTYSGQAVFPEHLGTGKLLKIAKRYLQAPFQHGGRSPLGIDDSGFVQMVFKMTGIDLPRQAQQQVSQGELIDFAGQAQPGDLAFFENHLGNISHVGIIFPEKKIIHAAEQVRVDKIDHYGIFNEDLNTYTYRLRVIKRILKQAVDLNQQKKEELAIQPNQVALWD